MLRSVRVAQDDMRGFLLIERKEKVAKTTVRWAMSVRRRRIRGFPQVARDHFHAVSEDLNEMSEDLNRMREDMGRVSEDWD